MEYTFTEMQQQKVRELLKTRSNQSIADVMNTVVERGLYDLQYRTKRNKQQYEQFKQFKAMQQQSK